MPPVSGPDLRQVFALIHVHTTASDGGSDPEGIARDARRAGVEVVMLTDHDQVSPGAGWRHGVLMVAGQEVTPRHNHVLAFGLDHPLPKLRGDGQNGDPAMSADLAHRAGGWSVLAHPLDPPISGLTASRSFVTLDFGRLPYGGVELWNAMSAFKQGLRTRRQGIMRVLMPRSYLSGPHPTLLALWDSVGRRRPWPALGGGDAHAFKSRRRWLPVPVFSYRRHMSLITTGIWLSRPFCGQAGPDQETVLEALAAGRCFMALGRARGFQCSLLGPEGRTLAPGAEAPFAPGWRLSVRLPGRGRIRVLCSGRVQSQSVGRSLLLPLKHAGVWRVEASRLRPPAGWRPWIFCNPFYLRPRSRGR